MLEKNQNDEFCIQCPHLKKYGNFCGKHKNYLIKKLIPITQDITNNNHTSKNNIATKNKNANI